MIKRCGMLLWSVSLACLSGCGGTPAPWYAEIVTDVVPVAARYSDDGQIYVIEKLSDGGLHLGTIDPSADERTFSDLGALTVDGAPVVETFGIPVGIDLAFRPDTDEVWAFVNGKVGRLDAGTAHMKTVIDLAVSGDNVLGALAFEDRSILHTGAYGTEWRIYPIDDAGAAGTYEIMQVTPPNSPLQPVAGPCQLDIAGGVAFATICEWSGQSLTLNLADRSYPQGADENDEYDYLTATAPVGLTDGVGLRNDGGTMCLLEIEERGYMRSDKNRTTQDLYCDGYQYLAVDPASRADVQPDGKGFLVVHDRAAMVMVQEDKPDNFNPDKTGTWCTGYFNSVVSTIMFGADGVLTFQRSDAGSGSEILYSTWNWSQSSDKITISYTGIEDTTIGGDEKFDMWARRVGNTLVIRMATDKDTTQHLVNAGYTFFTGTYYYCGP